MMDEAIDYNKVFVVKFFLHASSGFNIVDVDAFDSLDEAIEVLTLAGR